MEVGEESARSYLEHRNCNKDRETASLRSERPCRRRRVRSEQTVFKAVGVAMQYRTVMRLLAERSAKQELQML